MEDRKKKSDSSVPLLSYRTLDFENRVNNNLISKETDKNNRTCISKLKESVSQPTLNSRSPGKFVRFREPQYTRGFIRTL
jgi:hypothetical protein